MKIRVGQGYDIHALVPDRPLIIGGVQIAYDRGLLGHSDADVLLHAITDALFGAAGLGDIGTHFPDTAVEFKGADSRVLLREAVRRVTAQGWRIENVDCTVIAQQPKLASYMPAIRETIAEDLGIAGDTVNVKAKTNEKLGALGRSEGIAAQAAVLLLQD
ncbi:2-C-methyl-D-erythritol 2,4-cyclodiphosphate synthase [Robbsia sp. KACC 23696]|uniref:2-C-methyl-D-erythritol 2,4-cyclodiphosphate synthase n=1 Tax=Robbsia sp. KACC 23696 TaxID=3149231 RepID=UPI00325C2B8E